jgi:hypothetical protein
MPEINPSQVVAHQIRVFKNAEKFLRNRENFEAVRFIFSRLPTVPLQETAREPSRSTGWDIGLRDAVLKAIPLVRGDFIWRGVEAVMLQNGYEFNATDRRNAINGILRELVGGILVEVRKGKAGKPTVFRHASTQ